MNTAQTLDLETIQRFQKKWDSDKISHMASRALSRTCINNVCYCPEQAAKMNHKFSIDIPTLPATNQKSSGRCWIFASLNILREKIAKKLGLENFELSQNYISFFDHLEKSNTFLEYIIETFERPLEDRFVSKLLSSPVGDGGWWEYFVGLCCKYGVIPKEAMPENQQSDNSDDMNMLLNMLLRKDAFILRNSLKNGNSPEQVRILKEEMLSSVYNLLSAFLGNPPTEFHFEYMDKDRIFHADRSLSPTVFYNKYIGIDLTRIVSILNAPNVPYYETYVTAGEESIYGSFQAKRLNLPLDEFKDAVVRQLQHGEPVWFVCDCDYFCNMEEGIWDTNLYDYDSLLGTSLHLEKKDLLEYRQCSLNHAMLITGVNLVDGSPDKWKVQNSWGDEKGKKGYFIMSDEWFDTYVYTASIDLDYLTEDEIHKFHKPPTVMPPWSVLA